MMTGKGRGRGLSPNNNPGSFRSRGAPTSPPGDIRDLASGESSSGRFSAPLGADGGKKRKSNVISPLLPVNGVEKLKMREPRQGCAGGADRMDLPHGDSTDPALVSLDKAGVASTSGGLGGGLYPRFSGPVVLE